MRFMVARAPTVKYLHYLLPLKPLSQEMREEWGRALVTSQEKKALTLNIYATADVPTPGETSQCRFANNMHGTKYQPKITCS